MRVLLPPLLLLLLLLLLLQLQLLLHSSHQGYNLLRTELRRVGRRGWVLLLLLGIILSERVLLM